MNLELLFPGSIVLLKAMFRNGIDQKINEVIVARAVFLLPVDIVFMALSYLVTAVLVAGRGSFVDAPSLVDWIPPTAFTGLPILYIIAAFAFQVVAARTATAFEDDRKKLAAILGVLLYACALGILFATLSMGSK